MTTRPPLPPFTRESAVQKVRMAEDNWNSRSPEKVALGYSVDSRWRNRSEFVNGRQDIVAFLTRKWVKEIDYRLIKRALGLQRRPHRREVCIRVARRLGELVSILRQRELGIFSGRSDAASFRLH